MADDTRGTTPPATGSTAAPLGATGAGKHEAAAPPAGYGTQSPADAYGDRTTGIPAAANPPTATRTGTARPASRPQPTRPTRAPGRGGPNRP